MLKSIYNVFCRAFGVQVTIIQTRPSGSRAKSRVIKRVLVHSEAAAYREARRWGGRNVRVVAQDAALGFTFFERGLA